MAPNSIAGTGSTKQESSREDVSSSIESSHGEENDHAAKRRSWLDRVGDAVSHVVQRVALNTHIGPGGIGLVGGAWMQGYDERDAPRLEYPKAGEVLVLINLYLTDNVSLRSKVGCGRHESPRDGFQSRGSGALRC